MAFQTWRTSKPKRNFDCELQVMTAFESDELFSFCTKLDGQQHSAESAGVWFTGAHSKTSCSSAQTAFGNAFDLNANVCVCCFFPLHWLLLLIFKCRFDPVIFASKRTLEQSFSLHLSIQHALRCAYAQITHQPHYPNQSQRYLTFTTAISNTHSVCSIREFWLHYHKQRGQLPIEMLAKHRITALF